MSLAMDKSAVQSFIKSHRARLEQEKENLGMATVQPRTAGILPQDSAMYHREQLRRERQAEYQAFLRQQQATNRGSNTRAPTAIPSSDSLEEKRRALARERESELLSSQSHDQLPQHHYTASADNNTHRGKIDHQRNMWSIADRQRVHVNRGHTTSHQFREVPSERYDQRERRIQEERQYLGHRGGSHFLSGEMDRRGHWNKGSGAPRQVHFEHDYNDDVERIEAQEPRKGHNPRGQWDEEEEGLIQWAREQGKSRDPGIRARTPPSYPSTNRNADKINNRSISAPVVAGIAALGAGDTENDRRRKQKEYAEQLRAQMKEKEMAKKREREGLSSDYQATSVGHRRAGDPQQRPSHNSKFNTDTDEYKSSTMRGHPYRHERVHFSPDRDSRHDHSKYDSHHETHYRPVDSSSKTSYPSMPPYWPGYYYGGFPYPPPSNFPLLPPNGVPFYPPPPPSLPPSLSNPYLAAYHPPPPAGEFRSESKGGMKRSQEGLKDHLSPRKVQERGDEESKFNSSGGSEISKISKELYRSDLLEQMREKRESKQREQREKSEFERRKELEVYDPFGKGGCGAPLKDKRGHLVTDLKQMKKVNDERMIIGLPSTTPLPGEVAEGGAAGVLNNSLTEQQSSPQSSYDIRRSKELQSKIVQEGYREVLEQQMREREELKRKEKENKSKEEELEAERIQKELKILEEKYKQEKEREREKQHELKMKNEAMKREKEEKERAELERKQEEERREQEALRLEAEQKKQRLIDNMERQLSSHKQVRSNSPPIPTLRKLKSQFASPPTAPTHPQLQQRSSSPPVPTLRHKQLLDGAASQPQAEHVVSSVYNTATQPSTQQPRSTSPIVPALRNKLSAVSASGQPPQAKRSSSAHSGLPQTHSTGNDESRPGPSSHSAHQLPRLPIPQAHIPTSTSNPTPPTALAPPAVQPPLPVQEDEMENVLKNLHSMRQKLENERQKVSIHPQPHPVATSHPPAANVDSKAVSNTGTVHPSIKPQFLRPRLAAPRKTASTSGNPYPGKAQQAVEHRQRRKWQASPNEPSKAPPIPQLPHTHTNVQNNQQIIRNEGMFPTDTLKPLPVWLRPGGSGGQNSEDGFVLPHHRAPSVGGQSQFSIATLDVDSMARRNEERMQRLENILNMQSRDSRTPQTILSDFLARNSRARDFTQSNNTHHAPSMQPSSFYSTQRVKDRNTDFTSESRPDCETGYHPVAASTPTD